MERSAEQEVLLMRLATAYYVPLGWAIQDDEEVDPDDLAECLRSMEPVAAEIERIVAERLGAVRDLVLDLNVDPDYFVPKRILGDRLREVLKRIGPSGGGEG